MSLQPGSRIGPYEIAARIGEGGMGEVFRAHDTKLDRDVALKILPEAFSSDADRVMRFTREAKALASLNHPNIAQIYDAGREGTHAFIAMELVQGEDLSARIRRGAIPVGEALPLARQIADALAVAHDAGIVHRDLKPANIKVTDDDVVKVLDFGLAKGAASESSSTGNSGATMTSPAMTAMGLILGTASYMSPEQAKGKPVDRRADAWAFGVVLYEMLTGTFLFGREDITDTLAAVLTYEPDLTKLPAATPEPIKRLLAHCLAKDKRQRLDSMTAARIEIDDVLHSKTPAAAASVPRSALKAVSIAGFVAAGLIGGVLGASFYYSRRAVTAPDPPVLVAQIAAPRETISAFHDGFALSPDGSMLAFAARDTAGLRQLWIRRLDGDAARAVPGTDGAAHPFWAPGGGSLGFFADAKLKRVDVDGSRPQTICDAPGSFDSGSWNDRDEIVWATGRGKLTRVLKVSANGGPVAPFDALGISYGPVWLADGRRFFYVAQVATGGDELRLSSVDGQSFKAIAPLTRGSKEYAYGGGLLFLNKNEALTVQRFDEASGALTGSAAPIALIAGNPKDWFAVSSDGRRVVALVRQSAADTGDPGDPMARLIWVDRQGNTIGTLGDPAHYWTVRLAPDGKTAIANPGSDLWLLRPEGRHTRLTTGGIQSQSMAAIWNREGSEFVFYQDSVLKRRRLDPQSPVTPVVGPRGYAYDWSSDGRWLLTAGRSTDQSTTTDIMAFDFQTQTTRTWLATEFVETHPSFSPDGKWVAYASNASGRQEVYLRPFEGDAQPLAVSTNGGAHPFWRRDGSELFFLDPGDDVMSVSISRTGAAISAGKPQRLFRIPLNDITRASWAPYAVSPDGQRFLLNVPDRPTPLFFLQGLDAVIARK